jgi:hypothetical protein
VPRSPWQRAYVERFIGTIRLECLDHVIVLNEASLCRHVKSFLEYYHESRPHLSLAKDPPESRPVHPSELGAVVAIPQVGGLSPPLRAARSLSGQVGAGIPIPRTGVSIHALRRDNAPLFANRCGILVFTIIPGRSVCPNI